MSAIQVVDYDPEWPGRFEELRRMIWRAVSDVAVSIEHVGSTSVPGLAAKPIIDMDIVVPSEQSMPTVIDKLAALGYIHRGDLGIAGREAFQRPSHSPAHHLYACPQASLGLRNHLAVREYLRARPESIRAYGELKKSLAIQHPNDIDKYIAKKSDFLLAILHQSGLSADDLRKITSANQIK